LGAKKIIIALRNRSASLPLLSENAYTTKMLVNRIVFNFWADFRNMKRLENFWSFLHTLRDFCWWFFTS